MRVRFAPSPTGRLHIGTARTALFNWLLARSDAGTFLLRIEDTDQARSTREYEAAIIEDLRWLGLDWDEGPDIGGPFGPYRQSERTSRYREGADSLLENGSAYHCFCTAEELEGDRARALSEGRMPKYSGRCRDIPADTSRARLAAGEQATVRFRVPESRLVHFDDLVRGEMSFETAVIGDFVLLRSDGSAGYNFAVVVDDLDMRITHVMRGEDHLTNTARHILLFEALGAEAPRFAHLSMIVGKDRSKLSKREGAVSVGDYRERGYLPEALLNYLARLSWSPPDGTEILERDELVRLFSPDRISGSPAVFDIDKLDWLNGMWIRGLAPKEVLVRAKEIGVEPPDALDNDQAERACAAVQDSLEILTQLPDKMGVFVDEPVWDAEALKELLAPESRLGLEALFAKLKGADVSDVEQAREIMRDLAADMKKSGIKGKALYHPLRIALTGCSSGPELVNLLSVWGATETCRRLEKALEAAGRNGETA